MGGSGGAKPPLRNLRYPCLAPRGGLGGLAPQESPLITRALPPQRPCLAPVPCPQFFFVRKFFRPNFFSAENFFGRIFFRPKFFSSELFRPIFFRSSSVRLFRPSSVRPSENLVVPLLRAAVSFKNSSLGYSLVLALPGDFAFDRMAIHPTLLLRKMPVKKSDSRWAGFRRRRQLLSLLIQIKRKLKRRRKQKRNG